jgi:oligopeptide transport system permease protein
MLKFILKRLFFETIPSLLVIITVAFFLIRLAPGGPFSGEKNIAPEVLTQLNAHYGLNKPLYKQYTGYLNNIIHGNLGPSFKYPNRTVGELIGQAFPVSLELGLYALLFALIFGIAAGIIASLRPNTISDYLPMSLAMTGICIPSFVLGPILILVFSILLGWFNVSGWWEPRDRVLPGITLGMAYVAYIEHFEHAAAGLITGSFVVETIFQIPGLGRFFIMAAFNRDYTMIMGIVIFYATLIIILNTVVDILMTFLNPKLRLN